MTISCRRRRASRRSARGARFVLVAAVSVANGILSPFIAIVFNLSPIWMPELLPHTPGILFYLSSLILATATLLASGVPAALFERLAEIGRAHV